MSRASNSMAVKIYATLRGPINQHITEQIDTTNFADEYEPEDVPMAIMTGKLQAELGTMIVRDADEQVIRESDDGKTFIQAKVLRMIMPDDGGGFRIDLARVREGVKAWHKRGEEEFGPTL